MKNLKCSKCTFETPITDVMTFDTCPKCGSMELFVWNTPDFYSGSIKANLTKAEPIVKPAIVTPIAKAVEPKLEPAPVKEPEKAPEHSKAKEPIKEDKSKKAK